MRRIAAFFDRFPLNAALFLAVAGLAVARPAAAAPPYVPIAADEFRCLALNVYWESRSEPGAGQLAIAHLTLNRVEKGVFPDTICGVVHQGSESGRGRCQFSWTCDSRAEREPRGPAWEEALTFAKEALLNRRADPSNGALYVHNTSVRPQWAQKKRETARIGRHIFYR